MTRFRGRIGYYTGEMIESSPGVYDEQVVERTYRGDITKVTRDHNTPDSVNGETVLNHQISVVADAYSRENFFNIRYVVWGGSKWLVRKVEVNHPRLVLYLGAEFHDAS